MASRFIEIISMLSSLNNFVPYMFIKVTDIQNISIYIYIIIVILYNDSNDCNFPVDERS